MPLLARRGQLVALLVLLLTLVLLAGCTQGAPAPAQATGAKDQTTRVPVSGGGFYTDVGPAGLAPMLKEKDFLFINVHIPYEGEIEPTDLFIPYDKIEANLDKLPAEKSARIVLYCRSGSMSAIAARALVQRGYSDVWNLDGGMVAWRAAGYPVADKKR